MYIVEIIIKKLKIFRKKSQNIINKQESEEQSDCDNHIYLPIDSTKQYLACKNCGHIIKADGIKNKKIEN